MSQIKLSAVEFDFLRATLQHTRRLIGQIFAQSFASLHNRLAAT